VGKGGSDQVEISQAFLDALPDGIVAVDGEGMIRVASGSLARLSGYTAEELLGEPVETLIPARYHPVHAGLRAGYAAAGHPPRTMGGGLKIVLRAKDGTEIPVDIGLSPLHTAEGTLVVGAVRDGRERVARERELRDSQERFQLLINGVQDYALYMLDREGVVVSWNSGAERIKGYSAEEIVGKSFAVFFVEDDVRAGKPAEILRVAAETGHVREHGWRVKKGGVRFWADVAITALHDETGKLRGFSKVTRDITEFKRGQDRLQALLEIGQAILAGDPADTVLATVCRRAREIAGAAVATVSLPAGDGSNLAVQVAHGIGAEQLQGRLLPFAGSPAGQAFRTGHSVNMATGGPRDSGPTLVVPLKAGRFVFGAIAVANQPGEPAFGPEQQQLVELFAAQASVAVEYTRVREELGRMAILEDRERIGRELHDGVIQSLFAVGMNLQATALVVGQPDVSDRIDKAVTEIDNAILDLRNYIFGLRPGLLADRQLDQAISRLAQDLEAESGLTVVADLDPGLAARLSPIAGDIVQMVREALSNAARHAGPGTCRISLRQEGRLAVLEIADDGRGFDAGAPNAGGQGLPNLRERAEALGGTMELETTPGKGTMVRVRLPL
jgi:PAS domain S-box-containing protein